MAHFILIHGGLHGGWCWERIVPLLEAAGHTTFAPDLPGMGADKAPFAADPFGQWIDAMEGWLAGLAEPAILVGHSQGGPVISQAAERMPEKVAKLVYLTALMRRDGETVLGAEPGEMQGDLPIEVQLNEAGQVMLPPEMARAAFYNLCSEADIASALARLTPQPLAVMAARLALSEERFGRVPKFYVETRFDQAIPLETQREMQANWPCTRAATLETDHSPFYSDPQACAAALLALA